MRLKWDKKSDLDRLFTIIFFLNDIDRFLYFSKHKIAMTVIGLPIRQWTSYCEKGSLSIRVVSPSTRGLLEAGQTRSHLVKDEQDQAARTPRWLLHPSSQPWRLVTGLWLG